MTIVVDDIDAIKSKEEDEQKKEPVIEQKQNFVKSNKKTFVPIIVTESVSEPADLFPLSPLTPDDPLNVKFKQIMDTLKIKEDARKSMKQWSEQKKIQMILQYDFIHKGQQLIAEKKKYKKKHRPALLNKFKALTQNNKSNSADYAETIHQNNNSNSDKIESKFEQVMENLQIPTHARDVLREWPKDKKIQMIMQHDNMTKSKTLFKGKLQKFNLFKSKSHDQKHTKSETKSKMKKLEYEMPKHYKPSLSTGVYGCYCIDMNKSISRHLKIKPHIYKPSLSTGIYGMYRLNAVETGTKWSKTDVNSAITDKFETVMDMVEIPNDNRPVMREWNDDKKIQMIMQYEYYEKYNCKSKSKLILKSNSGKSGHKRSNSFLNKIKRLRMDKTEREISQSFSGDVDVISSKFEQIMETANIPQHSRDNMREWNDEKKIQLIMQYEFMEKSNFIQNGKSKNIKKKQKRRRSFKLGSKHIFGKRNSQKKNSSAFNIQQSFVSAPIMQVKEYKEINKEKIKDEIPHETDEIKYGNDSERDEIKEENDNDVHVSNDDSQPPLVFSMLSDKHDDFLFVGTMDEETSYLH
eukprot:98377_1